MDQAIMLNAAATGDTLAVQSFYDTKPVEQNADTLSFFSPNASKNALIDNYQSNPLNKEVVVFGVSFDTTLAYIRQAANVDPIKIANAIKHAVVEFKVAGGTKTLFTLPLSQLLNTTGTPATSAPGESIVSFNTTGNVRLAQPFRLLPQGNFDVIVRFKNAADFPTEAQWEAGGYANGLGLRCSLQTVSVEEYERLAAAARR